DMPFVFGGLVLGMPHAPNPIALANLALAVMVALIFAAVFSLRARVVVVAGVAAEILFVLAVLSTHAPREEVGRGIVNSSLIFSATLIGMFMVRWVIGLVRHISDEQAARERLGRYFSPAVSERIAASAVSQAEHRDVTVLFADVRNFTGIS